MLFTGLIIIIGFLVVKGYRAFNLELIFGDTRPLDAILLKRQVFDGFFPAIIGTLSLSDIVSGIGLAIGRCAEDTAVIMLTGVVAIAGIPK